MKSEFLYFVGLLLCRKRLFTLLVCCCFTVFSPSEGKPDKQGTPDEPKAKRKLRYSFCVSLGFFPKHSAFHEPLFRFLKYSYLLHLILHGKSPLFEAGIRLYYHRVSFNSPWMASVLLPRNIECLKRTTSLYSCLASSTLLVVCSFTFCDSTNIQDM